MGEGTITKARVPSVEGQDPRRRDDTRGKGGDGVRVVSISQKPWCSNRTGSLGDQNPSQWGPITAFCSLRNLSGF